MKEDFYAILGIDKSASAADIKKAYRKKAIEYHPDKNPGDSKAEELFKKAAEAYEVLSDPDKRAKYDQYGHAAFEGGFGGGGMNMDDIFSQFGDIFGSAFGGGGFGGFSGFGGSGTRRVKGSNLRIRVKLNLEEIAQGVEKKIKVRRKVMAEGVKYKNCTTCGGSGQQMKITNTILGRMQSATTCSSCGGVGQLIDSKPDQADAQGMVVREETVSIQIPAGVEEGMQLKVSGKGNDAPGQGIPGDLIVLVEEIEHESLTRDGENLHYELNLSFPDAALGCSVEIPSVSGPVKINIDAGTQPGKILRLKNKGLPNLQGYGKGDQLIHVNVWVPKSLSSEEKKAIEKLKDSKNFEPNPGKSDKGFFDRVKEMFS